MEGTTVFRDRGISSAPTGDKNPKTATDSSYRERAMSSPRVFMSYSHDSLEHKEWVERLATRLTENGIDTMLDQWDLTFGKDLTFFIEQGLAAADRVIVVCTDPYNEKANAGIGGVGYERQIVNREIIRDAGTDKFVPVVRGATGEKIPTFLGIRYYADFSDDAIFEEMLKELVRQLHRAPPERKPDLGPSPYAGGVTTVDRELAHLLDKGTSFWKKAGVIVTKFEEFLELAVGADEKALSDDQKAFLCCAAAHFGKFMKLMSDVAHSHQLSIASLVKNVAQSTYLRVAWRSAMMLEHFDAVVVDSVVRSFSGNVRNTELFPQPILERATVSNLQAKIAEEKVTPGTRDKLNEALRQVEDEFGEPGKV